MNTFETYDPFRQSVRQVFQFHTEQEVDAKLKTLVKAQEDWSSCDLTERVQGMHAIAQRIEEKKINWAKLCSNEMGKPQVQALAEIEKSLRALREIPSLLEKNSGLVLASDFGVILSLQPWNYPFWQVLRMASCAWITGHTVLLKHSEIVAEIAEELEGVCLWKNQPLLLNARLTPTHVHNLIEKDSRISFVTFTGSTEVGRKIAETCGRSLKPSILELGGNDAYIVCEDADLENAARKCAQARLVNGGQSCVSGKRFYIHHKIKKQFLEKFIQNLSEFRQGDPLNSEFNLGPLAHPRFAEKLQSQLKKAQALGAFYQVVQNLGAPFSPIGYLDFSKNLKAFEDEEIFASVALIYEFDNLESVIEVLNRGPYGLAGGIFTENKKLAYSVGERVRVGTWAWNQFCQSDPQLPFGGVKSSGWGREMGLFGVHSFVSWKVMQGF